jgi:hypothetical protein
MAGSSEGTTTIEENTEYTQQEKTIWLRNGLVGQRPRDYSLSGRLL